MKVSHNNPQARATEVVVQQIKDEVLIYDLLINKAFCLNPTAAAVWNLCDGKNSVSDIAAQLSKQLKQPVTDDLIWLAIADLQKQNLLDNSRVMSLSYSGLSRREAVRKIGLATMIALPVISSLVAPNAAMAASGCGIVGETCSQTRNCCQGIAICGGRFSAFTCVPCRAVGETGAVYGGTCAEKTANGQGDCSNDASQCCSGKADCVDIQGLGTCVCVA